MKKTYMLVCLSLCLFLLSGCTAMTESIDTGAILQQVETIASQIDAEAIVNRVIESIDWNELKNYAQKGYDALTEQFPALRSENVKSFLKENGLELLSSYIDGTDPQQQENARKLGEILKILNPEFSDEVDAVIAE